MSETANLAGELGGNGAPDKEAPAVQSAGANQDIQNRVGVDDGGRTQAAWTSQLSKELKDNPEALKAVGGYKTVSELVEAFVKQAEERRAEAAKVAAESFERTLEEKAKGSEPAPVWLDAEAVKATTAKLVEEFGPAAAEYYKKALSHNNLGAVLAKAGLKAHPDISRALVLLGRETSESYTPEGKSYGSGRTPVTPAGGASLYG
jgi:hypothetical protein